MKKLLIIAPALMAAQIAHGATLWLVSGSSTYRSPTNNTYYKCSNLSSIGCGNFGYCNVSYTSQSGGAGTDTSPYILTGCSISGGGCGSWKEYYTSSGCQECANDTRALSTNSSTPHTNTSCDYCETDKLRISKSVAPGVYITACDTCPSYGTCNGTTQVSCDRGYYGTTSCERCPSSGGVYGTTASTGATSITKCYIPSSVVMNFSDSTGSGTMQFKEDCFYSE